MRCPKCNEDMETVVYQDIEVDRCTNCDGLWFDASERDHLMRIEGSEVLDSGKPTATRSQNLMVNVVCPKCNEKMTHMVDDVQIHIHFEQCPNCGGQFFDAGEFRDLKDLTIVECFVAKLREFKREYFSGRQP